VTLVLSIIVLLAFSCITLLVRGASHMQHSWPNYQLGLNKLVHSLDSVTKAISKRLHIAHGLDQRAMKLYNYILNKLQDAISMMVNEILSMMSSSLSTLVFVILYLLFWLLHPLPIHGNTSALVRSYIWKKTLVSFFYGGATSLLFCLLGNDLAIFFGMITFFLNFVPEVGAIISMMIPIPVILLDGRLSSPMAVICKALAGQILLKFLFSNVLEVKLIENDREMSIHPVWIMLGLNYFGFVWGPVGMLISVPMLALLKSAALSVVVEKNDITSQWAQELLCCLEGRPERMRQQKTSRAAKKTQTTFSHEAKQPA